MQITTLLLAIVFVFHTPRVMAETVAFRIGTGGSAGNYFPIGSLVSKAITEANLQYIEPAE